MEVSCLKMAKLGRNLMRFMRYPLDPEQSAISGWWWKGIWYHLTFRFPGLLLEKVGIYL